MVRDATSLIATFKFILNYTPYKENVPGNLVDTCVQITTVHILLKLARISMGFRTVVGLSAKLRLQLPCLAVVCCNEDKVLKFNRVWLVIAALLLISFIPVRIAVTFRQVPTPQGIFVLGGDYNS
jgi:hypothetical protein